MKTNGYTLEMTCGAYPEQYDVYKDGKQVGYLRLRHGFFEAEYPDSDGVSVYTAEPEGDGMFADEFERERHLNAAIDALDKHIQSVA